MSDLIPDHIANAYIESMKYPPNDNIRRWLDDSLNDMLRSMGVPVYVAYPEYIAESIKESKQKALRMTAIQWLEVRDECD